MTQETTELKPVLTGFSPRSTLTPSAKGKNRKAFGLKKNDAINLKVLLLGSLAENPVLPGPSMVSETFFNLLTVK